MTTKLKDLESFAHEIANQIYPYTKIHVNDLRLMVARKFGISDYIQGSYLNALLDFGFLENDSLNMFIVHPKGKDKTRIEEEAGTEADQLVSELMKAQEEDKHAPEQH